MTTQRIRLIAAAIFAVALLGAIGGWMASRDVVNAQSDITAPGNVAANHGEGPGDVVVSWDAVDGATGYTVAWINIDALRRVLAADGPWLNLLQSVDVTESGQATYALTINELASGTEFGFIVSSNNSATGHVKWSNWVRLTPMGEEDFTDVHDVVQIQFAALEIAKHANALVAVGSVPTQFGMTPESVAANGVMISGHKDALDAQLVYLEAQNPGARVAYIRTLVDSLASNTDTIQAGRLPLLQALFSENTSWRQLVLSSVNRLYPEADASVDRQFYDLASNVHDISERDVLRYAHTNNLYANTGLGHTLLVVASTLDFHPYVEGIEEIYESVSGRLARDVEYLRHDTGAGLDPDVVALAERLRDAGGADGQSHYFELLTARIKMTETERALIMQNAQVLGQIVDQVHALSAEVQGLDAPAVPEMQPVETMDPGITADEIHFGQSAVLEGPSAELGTMMELGIRAAFEEANESGGVQGRKLTLTTINDDYEVDKAVYNTQALIDNHQVFALIGEVGTPTSRVALPIAEAAGVPFIGAFTGAQLLRGDDKTGVLNYRASYYQETERMVELLAAQGVTRVAVLYQSDSYGIDGLNGVKLALAGRNDMELVESWYYLRNTDAVQSAAFRIASANPAPEAVIIIATHEPAARLIEKLRMKLSSDTIFMAVSFVGSYPLADELGSATDNVYVTQVVPLPTDTSNPIVANYQRALAAVDADASPGFVSLEGYLAGRLAIERLNSCAADLSRDCFMDVFGARTTLNIDGVQLEFGPNDNQGSDTVFLTRIGSDGEYEVVPAIGSNP